MQDFTSSTVPYTSRAAQEIQGIDQPVIASYFLTIILGYSYLLMVSSRDPLQGPYPGISLFSALDAFILSLSVPLSS